jgi:cytochrome oxidase assembly protein ShyY1
MSVLRRLHRHRELIGLWLLAVIFAGACVLLGRWQLHRFQDKHAKAELVSRNHAAPVVPLQQLLATPDSALRPGDRYRAVRVQGTYDAEGTMLVRNRPHRGDAADASYGYEIVVPLVLPDGSALLVDRGWVPNGTSGSTPGGRPDVVPAPPGGTITVVARLRASEPPRGGRDLPAGQLASLSVPQIARNTGHRVYRAYGALVSETPTTPDAPAPLDPVRADGGEGINASYAVQWAVFALLGLGFPIWVIRRRRDAAAEDAASSDAPIRVGEPVSAAAGDEPRRAPAGVSPGTRAAPRKRRHHIWDDEDE